MASLPMKAPQTYKFNLRELPKIKSLSLLLFERNSGYVRFMQGITKKTHVEVLYAYNHSKYNQ